MKTERTKLIFLLSILFILLNFVVYTISEADKNTKIKIELKEKLKHLQIHYSILLHSQSILADAAYTSTVSNKIFLENFQKTTSATKKQKAVIRQKIYTLLKSKYDGLKVQGVLQYHFVLPNNESFLRMHKPSKFGDDLSEIREDYAYTNLTKLPIKGFIQGRTAHGFRNIYPIYAQDSTYLGAMEVSFSSAIFQHHLKDISHLHTHFLVNKDIFETKAWGKNDLVLKYVQSLEHKDYLLSIIDGINPHEKCVFNSRKNSKLTQVEINKGIQAKQEFSVYDTFTNKYATVASYFPIKNFTGTKVLAWLVSYEEDVSIPKSINTTKYIQIGFFFLFLILEFLLYKLIMANISISKDHKLVNDILNATHNIMFITDFNTLKFANKQFKDFFAITDEEKFKDLYPQTSSIFLQRKGYLHNQLKKEDESFSDLINKTQEENRIVLISDKYNNEKSFSITISKISSSYTNSYLVTLFDITRIKEKEFKMQKKVYFDGLTGIYNRSKFDEVISQEIQKAQEHSSFFTLCILDIDHFKMFNDRYGHLIGDEVLILLAQKIASQIRLSDTFARWGGEEFVILFPQTSQEEALIICEKLRVTIESSPHPVAGNVTASFGVSQFQKEDSAQSIFKRCDEALYLAKEEGRNRVCLK